MQTIQPMAYAEQPHKSLPILRLAPELAIDRFEEEYSIAALVSPALPANMVKLLITARMTNVAELKTVLEWDPVYRTMCEADMFLKMIVDNLCYYLASWSVSMSDIVTAIVNMLQLQQTNTFNDDDSRATFSPDYWTSFLTGNTWACVFILIKIGRIPDYNVPSVEDDNDDTDQPTQ